MKKIIPLLVTGVSFLLFLFVNVNVYAAEGGILNGKEMIVASDFLINNSRITKITDNDNTTYQVLNSTTSSYSTVAWQSLGDDYSIDSYKLLSSGNASYSSISFYDSNKQLIKTIVPSDGKGNIQTISTIDNVRYVSLKATNSVFNVFEFDVFGEIKPQPDDVPPSNVSGLTYTSRDTSITVSWTNPSDRDLAGHEIYFDDSLVKADVSKDVTSYTFNNLLPETSHLIKLVSYDSWGNKSSGASISASTLADSSKIPPANVTDLTETHTDKTVTLKWTNPSDSDLAGFKIYRNGSLIATKGVVTSFVDTDLVPDTSYSYKVVSYDTDGNESAGSLINVKTNSDKDLIPPDAPTGLKLTSMNGGIYVSWDKNKELDLDGYNVFVNGVKYNTNLVHGTSLLVEGLENAKEYQIQVTAVDTSENESEKSSVKTVAPNSHAMPSKMQMSYSLGDVANGIGSWFDSLWLVLAFAIGIPLSFYVASRVKLLFLS